MRQEELGIKVNEATARIQDIEAKQVRRLFQTDNGKKVLEQLVHRFYHDDLCAKDANRNPSPLMTYRNIGHREVIEYLVQMNTIGELGDE